MSLKTASRVSAVVYTGFSLLLALLFYLLSGLKPDIDQIARIGGAVWVFILSMIISMPMVIPYFNKKYMGEAAPASSHH